MRKSFCLKNICLGIGLGLVLSTSLNALIDRNPSDLNQDFSDSQVIVRAKQLGMNFNYELPSSNSNPNAREDKLETGNGDEYNQNSTDHTEVFLPEYIILEVSRGMDARTVASKLRDLGLVEVSEKFVDSIIKLGLERRIITGFYKFEKTIELETLIKLLTGE